MAKTEVSIQEAAAALGITTHRLRVLCHEGRVKGARRIGPEGQRGLWLVPVGDDGRPQIQEASSGPRATWAKGRRVKK